jgi:hypothetical protein
VAENIITRNIEPAPQAVTDALASLVAQCKAWPTEQVTVTIDRSAPPQPPTTTPVKGDEALVCEIAIGGSEYVAQQVEQVAWQGAAVGIIAAVLAVAILWVLYSGVQNLGRAVYGLWTIWRETRHV